MPLFVMIILKCISFLADSVPIMTGNRNTGFDRMRLNIGEKVEFLEYMQRDEILNYITHAHVLVMVRSNNLEAMASYPSKLTEYVATSKPVITVNVGEISDYYSDGVNAWVVEPENVEALAE